MRSVIWKFSTWMVGLIFWRFWKFQCKGLFGEKYASCIYLTWKVNHYKNWYELYREISGHVLVTSNILKRFRRWKKADQRTVLQIWKDRALNKNFFSLTGMNNSNLCKTFSWVAAFLQILEMWGSKSSLSSRGLPKALRSPQGWLFHHQCSSLLTSSPAPCDPVLHWRDSYKLALS